MSNFDFLRGTVPQLHGDCARAESYLASDPRSACFYSRRAAELLVRHLYDLLGLPPSYKADLAARTNASAFKAVAGTAITQKLNLIRTVGNTAVHKDQPIGRHDALAVLRELHHVMVWAAFHHSAHHGLAPTTAAFDPALAASAAPLSPSEVKALAEKFAAQDAAHARALEEKDQLAVAQDAQIAMLPSPTDTSCPREGSLSAPSSSGRGSGTTTSARRRRTSGTALSGARTDRRTRSGPRSSTGSSSTRTRSTRSSPR